MPDNITEVIEIKSIELKEYPENTDYVVKDRDGRIFHVYKYKKNTKVESGAYQQMIDMELRVQLSKDMPVVVEIWYAEVPNKKGGISRYIASFRETNGQPNQTPPRPEKAPGEANSASSEALGRPDWDEINVGKCQFGFLQAYIQAGHSIEDTKLQVIPARRLAELVVYGTQQTPKEELPTIHTGDADGENLLNDIPF